MVLGDWEHEDVDGRYRNGVLYLENRLDGGPAGVSPHVDDHTEAQLPHILTARKTYLVSLMDLCRMHCTAPHRTALQYTVPYRTAMYFTALHSVALYCTVPNCAALHCTALCCTALYSKAFYCTALH